MIMSIMHRRYYESVFELSVETVLSLPENINKHQSEAGNVTTAALRRLRIIMHSGTDVGWQFFCFQQVTTVTSHALDLTPSLTSNHHYHQLGLSSEACSKSTVHPGRRRHLNAG